MHSSFKTPIYCPDFAGECRECGSSPTVIVVDHIVPDTDLCGVHFFADRAMVDWQLWNLREDDTE